MKRDYDGTVARIAGNLLSGTLGLVTLEDVGKYGLKASTADVLHGAVLVARAIVAEVKLAEADDQDLK